MFYKTLFFLHQFENISKIDNKNEFYIIQATIGKNNYKSNKKVMIEKHNPKIPLP